MEKIKAFLKSRENQIFLLILVAALAIRLYFFFKTFNQALWWDEADYMSLAKSFAFGTPEAAAPWRARGMSLILSFFYLLGANEIFQRIIITILSTGCVGLTYILGKEFYDKKTGLIASSLLSVLWIHLFWSVRFSAETFALVIFMIAFLLFLKGFEQHKSKWYMLISGALIGYGIFLYEAMAAIFVVIFGYLLVTQRLKFLKNKQFWWWILGISVVLICVFMYNYSLFGHIFPRFQQITQGASIAEDTVSAGLLPIIQKVLTFFIQMPDYFKWPLIILFIIGLTTFIDLIFGFDILIKTNDEKLKKDFLVLWWALSIMLLFGVYISLGSGTYYEARYIFPAYPLMLIIAARGIILIADYLEKYKKHLGTIVIIAIIGIVAFTQLSYANDIILQKATSYSQERPAGEWLHANTQEGDVIIACGQTVPFIYYTEKQVIRYDVNATQIDELIANYSAKYLVVDLYAPDCNYNYPAERPNNLTLEQVYNEEEYTVIAIYKTSGYF